MSRRKLRDTELAAALASTDQAMVALARVVTEAGSRCADLERTMNLGTLDRDLALQRRDDLTIAQAAWNFHQTALLALVVAQEGSK